MQSFAYEDAEHQKISQDVVISQAFAKLAFGPGSALGKRLEDTRIVLTGAGAAGASARLCDMGPVGHYMLKRAGAWNDVAIDSALALLG